MTDKASGSGKPGPAGQRPVLLALRGRLNRRRNDRQGQPALAEELASALALAELTRDMDPALRARMIQRAARHLHPRGLETPPEGGG
jgi:hypothetical protein